MQPNNIIVLDSPLLDSDPDGGNAVANVYAFVLPVKLQIDKVVVTAATAMSSNLHVSCDSYVGTTQGNANIADIEFSAAGPLFEPVYDEVAKGTVLRAGDSILVQLDSSGDSGELYQVAIVGRAYDERPDNGALIETA